WNNGLFDGDTTCSTYGYFDGYFNDIAGFTGCEWLYFDGSNEYGLFVQWDSLPDANFQFNWINAELCGNGYIYGDFSGGTPGYYQGQFVIQPQEYCQSILVPFSFTISEPDPTPVIAEVDWDDQLFVDGTTCETSGYHYGNFDNPSDYDGCNEFFSDGWGSYGMWVEWDSMPEGSSMEFTSLYSVICGDWNEIGIEYSGASEGMYSGNFVIQPEASCQLIHIPFSFTVSEAPLEVVTAWSAPLNGETLCTGWGTSVTEFEMPTNVPCGEFNWVDSEFSPLDIVWTSQAPPPTIVSAGIDHCGTSSAHFAFTDAQSGVHSGYLRLAPNGLCEVVHIPFSFEVVEDDPTSLSLAPDWTSGFTGSECLFEGNGQASFAVPDAAYCSALPLTLNGGVSLGLDVIWTEMPAGSLMHITGAQAEICGGEGTLHVEYAGGTGGQYAGEFILSPNDTCLEFRVPFAFDLLNPTAVLEMTTEGMTPNDDGHFAVCPPMTLNFTGAASYSEDGQGSIEHWIWYTDDGQTDTLDVATPFDWIVNEAGVETVRLSVVDEAGCSSPLTDAIVLLGSPSPIVELDWSETVCAGSPGFAEVLSLHPGGWQNGEVNVEYDQPIYNTDYGQFDFTLEIDQYSDNAVVSGCNDLAVNLTIEHSYLGDLDILVTCPNGTTVPLLSYPNGGGSTFLGEPVDDGSNTPGTGYDYIWSTNPDNPSNVNSSSNWTNTSYTDNAGNLENSNIVNTGSYTPEGNLCDFTGCPLNGTWTLTLIDNLYIDDGNVFGWGMDFGVEPLGEPLVTIQPSIGSGADSAAWSGVGLLEQDYATWHADFVVNEPGLHEFTFTTLNNFGCTHDTTIQITAIEPPEMSISAGEDLLWCGEPLTLSGTVGDESPSPCSNSEESVSYCYSNNEYATWTYCPDDAGDGTMMSLVFEAGEIEGFFDHLYIHDGLDESAPLIMDLSGSWEAFNVTATNDFGCLYVVLTSDGSVSCSSGAYSTPIEWCSSCGTSNCAYDWSWEPSDWLNASDVASPQVEGLIETTTFIATVEPVSLEYCSVTDTVTVQIPEYEWECDGGSPCLDGSIWDDGMGQCVHADPCPWDLTGDGQVTTSDLLSFLGSFATYCEPDETVWPEEAAYCGPGTTWSAEDGGCIPDEACPADFTGDGIVGLADLLLLLPQMGNYCE
ncbi:MAG: proprotein convertase P-domain-containing protein, partial [Flavobacteriales bacterium]|nr:proprotein convertase P-domain-containing protein [Flavobacteriales bacterium]